MDNFKLRSQFHESGLFLQETYEMTVDRGTDLGVFQSAKTYRLSQCRIRLLYILLNGRVTNKCHVTGATCQALKCSGKTTERIVAGTTSFQCQSSAFLTDIGWIVTYMTMYITGIGIQATSWKRNFFRQSLMYLGITQQPKMEK